LGQKLRPIENRVGLS